MIYYKGSKFVLKHTNQDKDYYYCSFNQCKSKIVLKRNENGKIIGSFGYLQCFHEATPQIDLDRRRLYKSIINNEDGICVSNVKSRYEDALEKMVAETGNGVSFRSVSQRLYSNIETNERVAKTVTEVHSLLRENKDLINDSWNVIKINENNFIFFTNRGLERIKNCKLLGIDGNHKAVPKLNYNRNHKKWEQLVTFVAVYVNFVLFCFFVFIFALC